MCADDIPVTSWDAASLIAAIEMLDTVIPDWA